MLLDQDARQKTYKDNPNPNAKIGFVIFYPFQFYVFKNVYKYLAGQAEFIVDGGRFFPIESPSGLVENCVSFLAKQSVFYRVLYYEDYKSQRYLSDFFSGYKGLIGLWRSGCLNIPQTDNVRKVHMNYGAGKELTMFWTRHRNWDLYLCLGPRIYDIIRHYTWAEIVGYPKFDDWFCGALDENLIAEVKNRLDSSKKTILYLPTHGDLSSTDTIAGDLKKIAARYNVIVKVHYYTPREEPERMKKLEHPGIFLFQDDFDLIPLLKVADVVISDNSSAIFDAILADKPVAVTDFLSEDYLNNEHKKLRFFNFRLPEGALTYSQSIEQTIKKNGSVIAIKKAADLEGALVKALEDGPEFKKARQKLREEIFAFSDGKCGERAAAAIQKLISLDRLPEKPILYHVFEAEYQNFMEYSRNINLPTSYGKNLMSYYSQRAVLEIKNLSLLRRIAAIIKLFF